MDLQQVSFPSLDGIKPWRAQPWRSESQSVQCMPSGLPYVPDQPGVGNGALRLPGRTVPAEPGTRDAAGGGFSANGVRSNGQKNFLLNGVVNDVNLIDLINWTAYLVAPSVEAIGEMQILTNGFAPGPPVMPE